jgi:DNA-binding response OmpR family regulator
MALSSKLLPRILVVEDERLIAELMADIIREAGCYVAGIAPDMAGARVAIARADYDAVLLDYGLNQTLATDLADLLIERDVPFAFVTGYPHEILEIRHQHVPLLMKPFASDMLARTVRALVNLPPEAPGSDIQWVA